MSKFLWAEKCEGGPARPGTSPGEIKALGTKRTAEILRGEGHHGRRGLYRKYQEAPKTNVDSLHFNLGENMDQVIQEKSCIQVLPNIKFSHFTNTKCISNELIFSGTPKYHIFFICSGLFQFLNVNFYFALKCTIINCDNVSCKIPPSESRTQQSWPSAGKGINIPHKPMHILLLKIEKKSTEKGNIFRKKHLIGF